MASTKAGQLIKRGPKAWLIRIDLGRDAKGKRVRQNKTVHSSKKEAQKILNRMLVEKHAGTLIKPSAISLGEYLDYWLEAAAKPRISGRTHRDYARLLKCYVIPQLGERLLTSLMPHDIQKIYTKMLGSNLSPRTVRYTHAVLRNALGQAVRWRMAFQNPVEFVELPKQQKQEMKALSDSEVRRFLAVATKSEWSDLFHLLIFTGLRPGEAFGIQWRDLDLSNGTLVVRRTVTSNAEGKAILAEPKTSKSRRTVTFSPKLNRPPAKVT